MPRLHTFLARVAFLSLLVGVPQHVLSAWGISSITGATEPVSSSADPVLRTVSRVHHLSAETAAAHPPVRLRGMVTFVSAWPNAFFLQDATGGISVENDQPPGVFEGAEVEITGSAGPGLFAPLVHAANVRILGRGPMPHAPLYTYAELMGGGDDSTWLAIRGVVRSAKVTTQWTRQVLSLSVESDGGLVTVQLSHYAPDDAARLVDAVLRMRGVCTSDFNDKRQFTGVKLNVPSMDFVDVLEPPPSDPFAVPITRVRSLLQYDPNRRANHRLQIVGTVTFQDPGRALYLQDGTDGVFVATNQETLVPPGTRVAAVGFPSSGAYSPILRDAIFRPLWEGNAVIPKQIAAGDLLHKGGFLTAPNDAQLLRVQGHVVETTHRMNDTRWLVREGDTHFVAILIKKPGTPDPPDFENGTIVAVTGVLSVQADENGEPSLLRLLLRTPSDLHVVQSASWWSPRHTLSILAVVLAATLIITLWSALLRRTVRRQTYLLRESEERFRRQAQQDVLTGLGSRLFLQEQLQNAITEAQATGSRPGLLMVDLDHFKEVNDTLGHHAGDELLCAIAARIRDSVRDSDIVARMGGDEFVVLLKSVKNAAEARLISAKIVAAVSAPVHLGDHQINISASVGVCLYPDAGTNCDALLQNVDAAMYKAKAAGRNSFSMYRDTAVQPEPQILTASSMADAAQHALT